MSNKATYMGLGAPVADVEFLSTASTSVDLTVDQQNKLLVVDGAAIRQINLPAPEAGMSYHFVFNSSGGAASTATKVLSSGYDILVAGTTGKGVANETTAQGGAVFAVFAINSYRWIATRGSASSLNVNSTST